MNKVTVLGAGAWGTTMAQVLADCGNDVLLWGRSPELVKEINTSHTNKKYLGEHVLPNLFCLVSLRDRDLFVSQ